MERATQEKNSWPGRSRFVLASLMLSSGAALLIYLLTGISLGWGLIAGGVLLFGVGSAVWLSSKPDQRHTLRRRLLAGLLSGIVAIAMYDLSRLVLVLVLAFPISPFEAFPAFGEAILGREDDRSAALIVGVAYHLLNGLSFATAYAMAFGEYGVLAGFTWSMVLESFMLLTYPSWLQIEAYQEFLVMSLVGHAAYGLVLGICAQQLLKRRGRHRSNALPPHVGSMPPGV